MHNFKLVVILLLYSYNCIFVQIFYLEHVNVGQIKLPRASGLAPRICDWDEDAKSLVFEKVYKLGGMDSDKVGIRAPFSNSCFPFTLLNILQALEFL